MTQTMICSEQIEDEDMRYIKCPKCRTPFAKGHVGDGAVLEVKCRKCKHVWTVLSPVRTINSTN